MLSTVATHSAAAGMEARFATAFDAVPAQRFRATGAPVSILGDVRFSRPFSVMRARRALTRLLRDERPDIVICHAAWMLVLFGAVIARAGLPAVLWLHDPPVDGRPLHWLERLARRQRPSLVVCNSRYTAERAARVAPRAPAAVVYCPVPAPPPAAPEARDRLRREHGAAETVILQVGRWEPHKGHLVLLEALARLRGRPDWVCWQVGEAQRPHEVAYFEKVRARAEALGIAQRIRFLGWQPDVRALYNAADAYCQPNSDAEPFGITFVEALFAGLPVIAPALGGPAEIVTPEVGVLVAPGDVAGLVTALTRVLDHPGDRKRARAAGVRRATLLSDPAARMRELAALLWPLVTDEARDAIVARPAHSSSAVRMKAR